MCMAETMAHQLLGRSIQSSYLIISHVHCLFSHYPKSSLPRFVPFSSSPKHCFLSTSQKSASLSFFLCSATSHTPIAIVKNKQPPRYDDEEEHVYEEEYEDYEEKHHGGGDDEDIEEFSEVNNAVVSSVEQKQPSSTSTRLPQLTVKEKKELRSYAHSIGKKLKCHQVGKSGVTSSLETSINDALEANELLKLKVHDNCPDEVDVVAAQLQEATHSVVVGHIGRTFILYRPSHRKGATTEKQKPSGPSQRPQRSRIAKSAGWRRLLPKQQLSVASPIIVSIAPPVGTIAQTPHTFDAQAPHSCLLYSRSCSCHLMQTHSSQPPPLTLAAPCSHPFA